MLHKNLSAQCLDADGSYLHAAGTAGGSGLQFIKAGTLRATFYLRPIAFLFSHRKSLKIHYVILTGEIAISNHLYALLLPFCCCCCFSQVSSVTQNVVENINKIHFNKYYEVFK